MNDQQYKELMSELRAMSIIIKWVNDDISALREEVGELRMLVEMGGSSKQSQQSNWRLEKM